MSNASLLDERIVATKAMMIRVDALNIKVLADVLKGFDYTNSKDQTQSTRTWAWKQSSFEESICLPWN